MTTSIKVDGIAMYASVQTVNRHTGTYGLDLIVDAKTAAVLAEAGLSPAKDKAGNLKSYAEQGHDGAVFRFKRKTETRDKKPMSPPRVVDSMGTDIGILIGNGSKVRVYGTAYAYTTPSGTSGVAGGLNTLQIIDLVEYNTVDKVDGGYVGTATAPATAATPVTPIEQDGNPF